MESSSLKKSLRLLQLEKILIIKKEIGFIKNILKYFRGYEDNKINPSKKNIDKLLDDINILEGRLVNLEEINQDKNFLNIIDELKFILFYDYTRIQIEEMLLVIEALYTKMNQLFGEMLNQYIPYPTFFGRRFSSNGLMMYLDNFYLDLIKQLKKPAKDVNNKLVLGWSYNSGFKYKILRNRDIRRKNYFYQTHNDYIELPYWYYELPFLIPAITHEVVSIALKEQKKLYIKNKYEEFEKIIKDFFEDNSNKLVQNIGDTLGYTWIVKELSKEIFADMVAYEIHGYSYFLTLFHNLLGENIAKDFLEVVYEETFQDNSEQKIKSYTFKPNDWFFSAKREHNHLRLYFMLNYFENDKNCNIDSELKNEIVADCRDLLDVIMKLDSSNKNKKGFEKLFSENFPNYFSTYEIVQNYMQQIFSVIKDYRVTSQISIDKSVSVDFGSLWKNRFFTIQKDKDNKDLIPYKGEFRKLIHENLSGIEYLKDKEQEIKVLILRKVRKDKVNKLNTNTTKYNENDFYKEMDKILLSFKKNSWVAYGIYDFAFLESKSNVISLNTEFEKIKKNKKESLYYFDSRSILMKVADEINGTNTEECDFSIILNIELKKTDYDGRNFKSIVNGYNNLVFAISEIEKVLNNLKDSFVTANIYKSLGPKDLTVIIENSSIDSLYEIVNYINNTAEVNRTFTIFISDKLFGKLPTNYNFVTYIRVSKGQKDKIKRLRCKADIYQTTGVMDYIIHWKNIKEIDKLFEEYKKLFKYVTDYQTKIERKI